MNQKKESCLSCEQLSAEIQRLEKENLNLWRNNCKLLDDCIQLQKALLDRVRPSWKSKECLVVAFRSNRN